MAVLENLLAGWLTTFSLLLAVVAILAYRRSRNRRVLGVGVAFALFFVKGLIVSYALFTSATLEAVWVEMAAFDSAALLAFYLSSLRP